MTPWRRLLNFAAGLSLVVPIALAGDRLGDVGVFAFLVIVAWLATEAMLGVRDERR